MIPKFYLQSSILFGLILIVLNTIQAQELNIIESYNEDSNFDPIADFKIPRQLLAKLEKLYDNATSETVRTLKAKNSIERKSLNNYIQGSEASFKIHKYTTIALRATSRLNNAIQTNNNLGIKVISQLKLPEDFCPNVDAKSCDPYYPYRSSDGTCNNLQNTWWGSSNSPFKRLLPPEYDDQLTEPRQRSVLQNRQLPNARAVALTLHEPKRTTSDFSQFFVYFGQSIGRDLGFVAPVTVDGKTQKDCPCGTSDPDCFNIAIPQGERYMSGQSCIQMTRSAASIRSFDCYLGAREQLNLVSHYLDLSQLYGNNDNDNLNLRGPDGLLKFSISQNSYQNFPFSNPNGVCTPLSRTPCYVTGDKRAEDNAILSSAHTLWLREHNNVAGRLRDINPEWHEEKLYQEARRIAVAEYQHVIYNEWLPVLLGPTVTSAYNLKPLKSGYLTKYNNNLYPSLSNEFVTAAFRLHQLVNLISGKADSNLFSYGNAELNYFLYNMTDYVSDSDGLLRGTVLNTAYYSTPQINSVLNNRLYEGVAQLSSLGAINNQRGRDHGLPAYYKYRELCGLGRVRSFTDLTNIPRFVVEKLKALYPSVYDIDLFAGGVSELPVRGGTIGPTFACIIAKQFYDLKFGDRFFYENGDSRYNRFTLNQLNEIRKTTMARLLCNNVAVQYIANNPFYRPDKKFNQLINCSKFQRLNLQPWYSNSTRLREIEEYFQNLF